MNIHNLFAHPIQTISRAYHDYRFERALHTLAKDFPILIIYSEPNGGDNTPVRALHFAVDDKAFSDSIIAFIDQSLDEIVEERYGDAVEAARNSKSVKPEIRVQNGHITLKQDRDF